MDRADLSCAAALALTGTMFVAGCSSRAPARLDQQTLSNGTARRDAAPRREQALLEELALANRILARDLHILDTQGHVTARSRTNPTHYYIARYISPGAATTGDFIENDLDSLPVDGPRTDQAREIYLHGALYKARPEVMAIVHAHTPEFVAFGVTSVPLWNGDAAVPVWDIRPFNSGRSGVISTAALGKAMAEKMGNSEAVLLWAHGIALAAASLPEVITRVDELRDSARLQQAAIATGNVWTPQPRAATDAAVVERTWDYYKRSQLKAMGGRVLTSPEPVLDKPADPEEATKRDVVLANRILASEDLGILDPRGHVSVRNPRNANSYFIAPRVAAGAVTQADVILRDFSGSDADTQGLSIDDEIYKARPDVNAVLYARTSEIVAFTQGRVPLRPIVNGGGFIGDGWPIVDLRRLDPRQPLLRNRALGRSVVEALGPGSGVLLAGDGYVVTMPTVYTLVERAYQLRMNAVIQRQALGLRGTVRYLNDQPVVRTAQPASPQPAPTGAPEGRAWEYWSQNVALVK